MLKDELLGRLSVVDFNEYYPVFNKEKLIIKKVGKGFIVALPNHQEVTINESLMDIFDFCDGNNSLETVCQKMLDLYEAPMELLRNDIIVNLYEAWGFGLVLWKGNKNIYKNIYTYRIDDKITFSVTETSKVLNCINTNSNTGIKSSLYKPKVKYTTSKLEEALRERETLYYDVSFNDEIVCLIGLTPITDYSESEKIIYYSVDYIYLRAEAEVSAELFDVLMKWAVGFRNDGADNIILEFIADKGSFADNIEKIGFKQYGCVGEDAYFISKIEK